LGVHALVGLVHLPDAVAQLRLLLVTQPIHEAIVFLLHGADFLAQALVLFAKLRVVGAAALGRLGHLAGLGANAVGRLGAGAVLLALLVGGVDALPLLVAGLGLLPFLLLLLLASALRGGGLGTPLLLAARTLAASSLGQECRGHNQREDRGCR